MEKKITIVLGAILTVLAAFGLIQADESTQLLGYSSDVIVGGIGIYQIVRAIIKRNKKKEEPTEETK